MNCEKALPEMTINIIGAGLAGLSAARDLAGQGIRVRLISLQASERAQSNLAEGGINAALDVMGEDDTVQEHAADTERGGCYLADPVMVRDLTAAAPDIVRSLAALGVPFHHENGHMVQRNFGGQKKKRTAYAYSSTGKALTCAMIDAVRRYEVSGLVTRLCRHRFLELILKEEGNGPAGRRVCTGVKVLDTFTGRMLSLDGPVIMACGGFNGMFEGATTGTTANTGTAAAMLLWQGVKFANLEFMQYHPTTTGIAGKRLLISEAARGEGGRLFTYSNDADQEADKNRCYFMEEAYGERGNLMPRDVISREMAKLGRQVWLDLTGLPENVWKDRLADLRAEIIHYLGIDPRKIPVPVSPGIHFFMGGIAVDRSHRTDIAGLYAAGECACAYHGANRLGGNSLLGALYGGRTAAEAAAEDVREGRTRKRQEAASEDGAGQTVLTAAELSPWEQKADRQMQQALLSGMRILRTRSCLQEALDKIRTIREELQGQPSRELEARFLFAEAVLQSALARRESRGAHTRLDAPETLDEYHKTTIACRDGDGIRIFFQDIPDSAETAGGKGGEA